MNSTIGSTAFCSKKSMSKMVCFPPIPHTAHGCSEPGLLCGDFRLLSRSMAVGCSVADGFAGVYKKLHCPGLPLRSLISLTHSLRVEPHFCRFPLRNYTNFASSHVTTSSLHPRRGVVYYSIRVPRNFANSQVLIQVSIVETRVDILKQGLCVARH